MSQAFERISVIGLGYIGLPTAAMFASRRKRVIGVDCDPRVVETISNGRIHIVEPELDILVHAAVHEGFLTATRTPEPADAFLIAVPTPFKEGHVPDLAYVKSATESIAPVLKKGDLVVLESTSPVGTTEQLSAWLAEARPDLTFPHQDAAAPDVHIAYCPERVLPGKVVHELVSNDRVIGGLTPACSARARSLYEIFVTGELVPSSSRAAELTKLVENSYRDVNIAFANELSMICDRLTIDPWEVIALANRHPRVNILQPGAGVGGHCIAVDPWFIVHRTPEEARLIRTAREVNDHKPEWAVSKVRQAIGRVIERDSTRAPEQVTVAVLGLAFKPNIDDLRESPAVRIAETLSSLPCKFDLVEPHVDRLPQRLSKHRLVELDEALAEADVVVVLVAHRQFVDLPAKLRPSQQVVDVVGVLGQG